MPTIRPRESDINSGIKKILQLDGWHVFNMETISRREWGKGTGEKGMPDLLAIRYLDHDEIHIPTSKGRITAILKSPAAEVLWIEGKRPGGTVANHQRIWHRAERDRGALVWVAGIGFPASVDGFKEHYEASGLCRRQSS